MTRRTINPGRSVQRGFTLVELLLSMVLLGLIMVLAYSGLRTSTRSVDRGEDYIDRINRVRLVQQFLRDQLSRSLPLILDDQDRARDDAPDVIIFEGSDDTLRWVAPMPGYLGRGGPHEQVLRIERGADGYELLYAFQLLGTLDAVDPMDNPDRPPVILLDGIESGRFQFMTVDDEQEPTDWLDDWEDPSVSPLLVRIELEMDPESRLFWPTLNVATLIDGMTTRTAPNLLIPGGGSSEDNRVTPDSARQIDEARREAEQ